MEGDVQQQEAPSPGAISQTEPKFRQDDRLGSSKQPGKGRDGKKPKGKPKPLYFWASADVNKWLRKHCGQSHAMYGETFLNHDITGRTLLKLNDNKLQRMGITDFQHREELLRHIVRLRLKSEMVELKSLEQKKTLT